VWSHYVNTHRVKVLLKQLLPYPVFFTARRLYHNVYLPSRYGAVERNDIAALAEVGMEVAPPARLRHRTHGAPDLASFLRVGHRLHTTLEDGVRRLGGSLGELPRVLDFGCGAGRTALWFRKHHPQIDYYGVDLDRECVEWLQQHMPFGRYEVNTSTPPLTFAAGTFDLIFSISVFTHLSENFANRWLQELRRVARPGGYICLSIHHEQCNRQLPGSQQRELAERGFCHARSGALQDVFADEYQNTYHTWDYIREQWGQTFTVVDRINIGVQDLVLMRADG
jgi:SAM-dependent methyltransferase